jgi:hypothetical protein
MRLDPIFSYFTPTQTMLFLGAAVIALVGLTIWIVLKRRIPPAERERRRRLAVMKTGRMGDAMITDVQEEALYYTYLVRGVEYIASQDISTLRNLLPENLGLLVGPATLRYTPRNPANSILLCEEWSGVRTHSVAAGNGNGGEAAKGTGS